MPPYRYVKTFNFGKFSGEWKVVLPVGEPNLNNIPYYDLLEF